MELTEKIHGVLEQLHDDGLRNDSLPHEELLHEFPVRHLCSS